MTIVEAIFPGGACLRIVEGSLRAAYDGICLEVSLDVARMDVDWSLFAEKIASLLLVNPESIEGSWRVLEALINRFRDRVVREELRGLKSVMGPLYNHLDLDPLLLPVIRMMSSQPLHCIYKPALEIQVEDLRADWNGRLQRASRGPRTPGYSDGLRAAARMTLRTASTVFKALDLFVKENSRCQPHKILKEPWTLVRAPEGYIAPYSCSNVKELLPLAGCKRPNPISSSRVCGDGESKIVVKDYSVAFYKWVLAAPLAVSYGFKLSPNARAANEYIWYHRLRKAVGTPRVIALCLEPRRAIMWREYVEGSPLSELSDEESWVRGGSVMALVHYHAEAALGDANPGNILLSGGDAYVLDAEQAKEFNYWRGAWDLSIAAAYSMVLLHKPARLIEALLEGYWVEAPRTEASRVISLLISPGFIKSTPTSLAVALVLRRAAKRLLDGQLRNI